MSIVTLDRVKEHLDIDPTDVAADAELQHYVDGITAVIEREKREIIEQRQMTERLRLTGRRSFRLWFVPVITLDSLVSLDGSVTWDVSPSVMDVDGGSGLVEVLSGTRPCGRARATYTAGYETVPENYIMGGLVIIQHVWQTQRGPGKLGTGLIGPEEIRRTLSAFTIPAKAREWLGPPRPVVG